MEKKWKTTDKRFVAFFDIMGFKELVERNPHNVIVEKLKKLNEDIIHIESMHDSEYLKKQKISVSESKAITFSDSIIIFSKDSTEESLNKIIIDSVYVLWSALQNEIPIKGAISFGEITVDFDAPLFFGRPIIDAYLLHDQLVMYSAILDHNVEKIIKEKNLVEKLDLLIVKYNTNLKSGKINHFLIRFPKTNLDEGILLLEKHYGNVSGQPRIYVDNTINFFKTLKS